MNHSRPAFLSAALVRQMVPRRPVASQKGLNGHVLVIAGSRGMSGAPLLTALGALRAGAGLVSVALPAAERWPLSARLPEALALPWPENASGAISPKVFPLVQSYCKERRVTTIAVGPGLSQRPGVRGFLLKLLAAWSNALVLDADALNALTPADLIKRDNKLTVLTPHPGEFKRFFKIKPETSTADRVMVTEQKARELQLTCLLKGNESVISDGHQTWINPTGNSAMSTGGMGDILTGVISALMAQGLKPLDAAAAGAYLHGLAADQSRIADRGLLAHEVADAIPSALKTLHGRS